MAVKGALTACFQFLLGEAAEIELPTDLRTFEGPRRDMHSLIVRVMTGAQHFVWHHEFGHLLRGHLERRPSHQVEREADEFAAAVTLSKGVNQAFWESVGVVFLFLSLRIVEQRNGTSANQTHPPIRERLMAFVGLSGPHQELLVRLTNSATAACNEVLEETWGFRITWADSQSDRRTLLRETLRDVLDVCDDVLGYRCGEERGISWSRTLRLWKKPGQACFQFPSSDRAQSFPSLTSRCAQLP